MTDIASTNAPLVSSISSTLLRLLPHMNSSTAGGQSATDSDIHTGDNHSMATDASCSSCNSSCPSFVNDQDVLGHYRLIKTLGVGEFGKVKLGIRVGTEEKVAIKIVKKKVVGAKLAKVEREIQILKALHHPHIVKLIEVVETDTRVGIVLEYALGGELFEYIWSLKFLEEDSAKNLFAQLISGVNHMHLKGVVHRDLKLENLLFLDAEQTQLVISDFGFSNNDNNGLLSTCCGSPTYAAPELIYPSESYSGAIADVWSCGVILYCMICGYLPFDDDPQNPESANLRRLYQHIRSSTLSFPEFVSDDAKNLIQQMLRPDPVNRCTIQDVINHPWLQSRYSALFVAPSEQLEQQTPDSIVNHGESKQRNLGSTAANVEPIEKNMNSLENHHKIRHRHRSRELDKQELYQQQDDHQDVAIQTDELELQHPAGTFPPTPRSMMDGSKLSSNSETNNTDSATDDSRLKNKELPLLPPLPPFTPEEHAALNGNFGFERHQRQRKPSLRRQKKIRPSFMDAQPMPSLSTTKLTTTTNSDLEDWSDNENNAFGIRPSLLGKDNSIMLRKNNKRITSSSVDGTQGNSVQNMKSISLPLLNQASQICTTVDSTISVTNLNDGAIDEQSAAIKKRRRRFASFLSKTHPGPRPQPQRSQSTRLPKRFNDDDDDQGITLKQKDTSTTTTTATTTTTPVTRRRTMTQAMKAWIHKKKPFVKQQQPSSFSSLSETSSSFVGSADANHSNQSATNHHQQQHQQQQQQQQNQGEVDEEQQEAHHYLVPISVETTPVDQSKMRTFTHAQGEHLTSMAPGQLILTLVRVLTALGFDVQHHSSYQLTCTRKSHQPPTSHHHFYSWNYHGSIKQKKNNGNNKTETVSTAPIYGPPELDQGQEVEFTVEVCRSLLSDIYVVDIQHACGDYASFQFLRFKVLSLLNLNA